MAISSLAATMAAFVRESTYAGLPGDVVRVAPQHLLDIIGCCLAATKVDTTHILRDYLLAEGGTEQATAIGVPSRLPVPQAHCSTRTGRRCKS